MSEAKDFLQMPVFRIDHVLHHPDLKIGVQQVRIPHSDHQGLFCRLIDSINDDRYGCTLIRLSRAIRIRVRLIELRQLSLIGCTRAS